MTIIKNTLVGILFFAFTLTNCSSKRQKLLSDGNPFINRDLLSNMPDNFDNINDPAELIASLDNSTNLEDEYIGLGGTKSTSFEIYKRLRFIASDTALIRLAHNRNPKIRVYAMWTLTCKNKRLALQQLEQLKNDKGIVMYESGCMTLPTQVCVLIASRFDSTEVEIKQHLKSHYLNFDIRIK